MAEEPARPMAQREVVARRLASPPTIDGSLEEWTGEPGIRIEDASLGLTLGNPPTPLRWTGPTDLSAQVHVAWDDHRLVLAGRVRDDASYLHPGRLWIGDCLELFLRVPEDGAPQDFQFVFAPLAQDVRWTLERHRGRRGVTDGGLNGVEVAAREVRDEAGVYAGYTFEIALPFANHRGFHPADGTVLGFNLALVDADLEPGQKSYFLWHGDSPPALDPDALGSLRFEGRSVAPPPAATVESALEDWTVPGLLVGATALLLALLWWARVPLGGVADLPFRRKVPALVILVLLLFLVRAVPDVVRARRTAAASSALEAAAAALTEATTEGAAAQILLPSRDAPDAGILDFLAGQPRSPRAEYRHTPRVPRPAPLRRTSSSDTPVRVLPIPLEGAGRLLFRLPEPVDTQRCVVVARWRLPGPGEPVSPPGTPLARFTVLATDGFAETVELRAGLELDSDTAFLEGGHDVAEGAIAWVDRPVDGMDRHCDEVTVRLSSIRAVTALEFEQVAPEGAVIVEGVTALPADGGAPRPLLLGRATATGVPTASWNGGPSEEIVVLDTTAPKAVIPVGVEADRLSVVYGCIAGLDPARVGEREMSLTVLLEDGTRLPTVFLLNGVHLDVERLATGDHAAEFAAAIAWKWPGPSGDLLHRDILELAVPHPPGVAVRALEAELLGSAGPFVIDAVTASRLIPRTTVVSAVALERSAGGLRPGPRVREALDGVAATHFVSGKAVASTLPTTVRERVLGTELPGDAAPPVDGTATGPEYRRSLGGAPWMSRTVRLPFRESDEVIELALPAPDTRDLETPLRAMQVLLIALLLPLGLAACLDLIGTLPHLRWKLVGAFALASVVPLLILTVSLVRQFQERMDDGADLEVRAQAASVARILQRRRDEARRMAETILKDESLRLALEDPDPIQRVTRLDAAVRDAQFRAGGLRAGVRVALEETGTDGAGRALRRTYPQRETPASLTGIYEPRNDLAIRWGRLVATGVARERTSTGSARVIVETPVDDALLTDLRRAGADRAHILLYSPSGYPLAGTLPQVEERSPAAVEARRDLANRLRRDPGEPGIVLRELDGVPHVFAYDLVRSADLGTVGLLATALPRTPLTAATLGMRDLLVALGGAAVVLAVVLGNLVTRRVAEPILSLARAVRRVEKGDLDARAEPRGRDELALLGRAFNRMTDQLRGRIGELSVLHESMAEFAATLDRRQVLDRAMETFRRIPGMENGPAVLLVLEEAEGADLAAGVEGELAVPPRRIPGNGLLRAHCGGDAPRTVEHPARAAAEAGADPAEVALLERWTEAVFLPFSAGGGRTEGVVVLLTGTDAPVPEASLKFLAALARQVGIALENARLYRLAVEDPGSGLLLPAYFRRRLGEEIDRSVPAGRPVSLLLLSIEGGGARTGAGDDARLRTAAARLRADLRRMHLLGRLDRSTVAVLLPETDGDEARETATRLAALLERPVALGGGDGGEAAPRLRVAAAAVTAPGDAGSAEFLEHEALRALDRARRLQGGQAPREPDSELPAGVDAAEADALGFRSAKSVHLLDALNRIAGSDVPVLILGETGSGKEVVADLLHRKSRRSGGPLVTVNCAALPGPLLESELFGYERGAFTGAERRHRGRFEQAHGGTLFLDEIGEMPAALQVKLLRVLQDRKVERLGGTGSIEVDVRILAATHRDLPDMIAAGTFREDLYFRLNVLSVVVPPLRARREDLPLLAARFLREAVLAHGGGPSEFTPEALDFLFRHPFRGNVRELRNMVERAVVTARGPRVTPGDLNFGERTPTLSGRGPLSASPPPAPPVPSPAPSMPPVLSLPPAPPMTPPVSRGTVSSGDSTYGVPFRTAPSSTENSLPSRVAEGAPPAGAAAAPVQLSARADRLLLFLRNRGSLTNRAWCEEAGVSARSGLRDFEELLERGLAIRTGKRRGAVYRAVD